MNNATSYKALKRKFEDLSLFFGLFQLLFIAYGGGNTGEGGG